MKTWRKEARKAFTIEVVLVLNAIQPTQTPDSHYAASLGLNMWTSHGWWDFICHFIYSEHLFWIKHCDEHYCIPSLHHPWQVGSDIIYPPKQIEDWIWLMDSSFLILCLECMCNGWSESSRLGPGVESTYWGQQKNKIEEAWVASYHKTTHELGNWGTEQHAPGQSASGRLCQDVSDSEVCAASLLGLLAKIKWSLCSSPHPAPYQIWNLAPSLQLPSGAVHHAEG